MERRENFKNFLGVIPQTPSRGDPAPDPYGEKVNKRHTKKEKKRMGREGKEEVWEGASRLWSVDKILETPLSGSLRPPLI